MPDGKTCSHQLDFSILFMVKTSLRQNRWYLNFSPLREQLGEHGMRCMGLAAAPGRVGGRDEVTFKMSRPVSSCTCVPGKEK